MACPLFKQRGLRCACLAVAGENVPTLHEREVYCRTSAHTTCPTLLVRIRKGRALSENEYLTVWTGEAERASDVAS